MGKCEWHAKLRQDGSARARHERGLSFEDEGGLSQGKKEGKR